MIPAAAILTAWGCIAWGMGVTLGRAIKKADPGEDDYSPPTSVPQPDNSWTDLIPVDSLSDGDLLNERFFALVEGPAWFGGALTDPRRKLGGAQ